MPGIGIGLPVIRTYYKVAHLTRLIDWYYHAEAKHWVAMEMEDSCGTTKSWPWITLLLPKILSERPTLGSTLKVSINTFFSSSVSQLPSPMIPVLSNLEF